MSPHRWSLLWGYVVEFILTALVYIFIRLSFGTAMAVQVVSGAANSWAALVRGFFALSGGLFAIFVKLLTSDFGNWLSWRQAERVYTGAFVIALAAHVCAIVFLVVAGVTKEETVGRIALALLIFSGVNMCSLMGNVLKVVKLYREFSRQLGKRGDVD